MYQLGIIGCGNMAEAILQNVIAKAVISPSAIVVCDRFEDKTISFAKRFKTATAVSPLALASQCQCILFAIKPQDAKAVFLDVAPAFKESRKTAISIIAGLPISAMESWLPPTTPIVRVMPNTPIQVGEGMSVYTANAACTSQEINDAQSLFAAGGVCLSAPESAFDAVTALSGSGPAYLFLFLEALIEAGEQLSLSPAVAATLARQTLKGALSLAEHSPDSPATLREKVTSKGGTTAAALSVMENAHFKEIIGKALSAAAARSCELSKALISES